MSLKLVTSREGPRLSEDDGGECADIGKMKEQRTDKKYTLRSFLICSVHVNQNASDGCDM
jgi:hypothetical protein